MGDQNLTAQKLDITLTLLDKNNNPVATSQPRAASDGKSPPTFNIHSEISAADATSLIVDIRHEGFTSFSRRTPIKPTIYLNASLETLTESIVMPAQNISVSGATTNGFTIKSQESGQEKPSMSISIPASSLPAGTGSLTAAIKTYDPNNAEDAQYFPGSYADATGNRLVSVAFNYADVRTSTGESLQSIAQNARALRQTLGSVAFLDPPEPVVINRDIPASSCATLEKLGDANSAQPGFQIPVYTYNPKSGLWELLGYGSVYTDLGVALSGDTSELDCANTHYVLEIKVSNEIFLSDWWNLDYPLQFAAPQKLCANLRILNEANEPLAGVHGLIAGNGDFASEYFVSDENGNAAVSVEAAIENSGNGNYIIWGESAAFGSINLSTTCPAPTLQTIVVKRPQLCKIKGHVESSSGKDVRYLWVSAVADGTLFTPYSYAFSVTDSEGNYTLDIACNTAYTVQTYTSAEGMYTGINVNGETEAHEQSDDGKQVTVTPLTLTKPPLATSLTAIGYDPEQKAGILIFFGMYDAFPIDYDVQLKNTATGEVLASAKGNLTYDDTLFDEDPPEWFAKVGRLDIPFTLPEDLTNLFVIGSFTDGFGIEKKVNQPVQNPDDNGPEVPEIPEKPQ